MMTRSRLLNGICLLLIAISALLRVDMARNITQLEYDDAISYLAATGHQMSYSEDSETLTKRWVSAPQLKNLIAVDERFAFGSIKRGLLSTDFHPPLYFWLLHVWLLLVGFSKSAGPLLNILIFLCTVTLLYKLSILITRDRGSSLAIAAIFAASPVTIEISSITRQYELFMFLSLAAFYIGIIYIDRSRHFFFLHHLLLSLVLLLGMLAHYYFFIIAITVASLIWYYNRDITSRRLQLFFFSAVLSAAAFFAVLPGFFAQVQELQHAKRAFVVEQAFANAERVIDALLYFGGWRQWWPPWIAVLFLVGVFCFGRFLTPKIATRIDPENPEAIRYDKVVWYYLTTSMGLIAALHVLQFSPAHAMGARYIASVAPLLAIAVFLLLRRIGSWHREALVIFAVVLLASSIELFSQRKLDHPRFSAIATAGRLVIDNPERGVVFPEVINLRGDAYIFVTWRRTLIDQPTAWLDKLDHGDVVLLVGTSDNELVAADPLVALINERYQAKDIAQYPWRMLIIDSQKSP